ncbi:hypothetical protein OJ918_10470, partial [Streptococcus anginosus]|uniref:hypothetical protein n=1 Tax=Streptococcus anginosus TaxID=1328 RepID=UPI0021F877D3
NLVRKLLEILKEHKESLIAKAGTKAPRFCLLWLSQRDSFLHNLYRQVIAIFQKYTVFIHTQKA